MQPSFRQTGIISRLLPMRCREKTAVNTRILEITQLLNQLSNRVHQRPDNVFERQLALRLLLIADQVHGLAQGTLTFTSTETWRSVYEEVLEACRTMAYVSVAVVNSDAYWRDAPGNSSLEFNYRLVAHGFIVHRLFIIDDYFWPTVADLPARELFNWIVDQYHHGIEVSLLRASDLDEDRNLLCDFGIYGKRAVGYQSTDETGRTTRYELHFDESSIQLAEQRWKQLQLYAIPLENLLDQIDKAS